VGFKIIPHFQIRVPFHPIGELGGAEERLLLETGPAHAGLAHPAHAGTPCTHRHRSLVGRGGIQSFVKDKALAHTKYKKKGQKTRYLESMKKALST